MKKTKTKNLHSSIALIIAGALISATTPILKDVLQFLLTKDCPIVWRARECGIGEGLQHATFIIVSMSLWAWVGVILFVVGLVLYLNIKKSR
jgi:hypothetical protein